MTYLFNKRTACLITAICKVLRKVFLIRRVVRAKVHAGVRVLGLLPRLIEGSVGRPFFLALIVFIVRLQVHILIHINSYPTSSIVVSRILEIRHLYHHIYSKENLVFCSSYPSYCRHLCSFYKAAATALRGRTQSCLMTNAD